MICYCGIIFLVFIISLSSVDKRTNQAFLFYFTAIVFATLSLYAGTRLIGLDYETYRAHFNVVPNLIQYSRIDTSMEIGYEFFLSICKSISESYHFFLFTFAGVTIGIAFLIFYKYSPYPLLSFYLFFSYSFFGQVMGQMRQPFAVLITYLILLPLLLKQKRIWTSIWIIIAGILFHKSILFLLFCLPFTDKVLNKKTICFISILAAVCYVLAPILSEILPLMIPQNFFLYDAAIAYLTYNSYTLTFTMGLLERILMTGVLFYFSLKYGLYFKNVLLRIFVNLYFIGSCLYIAFISISAEFASRGTQSFGYALFFALPILIKEIKGKEKYILLSIAYSWAIYVSFSFMKDSDIYLPYKTILF